MKSKRIDNSLGEIEDNENAEFVDDTERDLNYLIKNSNLVSSTKSLRLITPIELEQEKKENILEELQLVRKEISIRSNSRKYTTPIRVIDKIRTTKKISKVNLQKILEDVAVESKGSNKMFDWDLKI